jgi:hypothetical protein
MAKPEQTPPSFNVRYCLLHKSLNWIVPKAGQNQWFWFRYLRSTLKLLYTNFKCKKSDIYPTHCASPRRWLTNYELGGETADRAPRYYESRQTLAYGNWKWHGDRVL